MTTPVEREVSSTQPEIQMVRDINLTRLAAVVGGDIIRVGPSGDNRIAAIDCARLGLSLVVTNVDHHSFLSNIRFEGLRPAHSMDDGRVAVIWDENEVTFVHSPKTVHGGDRVVDMVIINREEGYGDIRIPFDQASEEVREAAEFVERNTVPVPTGASVDQPDNSY